jgi:hypothetical protein
VRPVQTELCGGTSKSGQEGTVKAFLKNFGVAIVCLSWVGLLIRLEWLTIRAFVYESPARYHLLVGLVLGAALTVAAVLTAGGSFRDRKSS